MALDKEKGLIHSQRFFQTMFEQVPCYITVQDRDFNLLAVNKMFEDGFGREVGEECYAAYKGRDGVCPDCSVATTFEGGQIHSSEETVIRQDGSRFRFLVQTAPLLDHEGDITAVMEISTDVTAIRRLEEQTSFYAPWPTSRSGSTATLWSFAIRKSATRFRSKGDSSMNRSYLKNRNMVQDRGRAEKTTAVIYGNILRIGFSALTMRLGHRAFLR